MKRELIIFADCLSEVFSSGNVDRLNNIPLRTYLPVLKLESLRKLYQSIHQASNFQRELLSPEIPNLVANEIVFRTLVKIPRNFAPLKEFLATFFPKDRLNDFIKRIIPFESPPLYPRLKDLLDFDLAYLDALKSSLEIPTQFSDAIQRVLSRFANETYFVNLLFAVDKDFSGDEVSFQTKQILTEHLLDGFARQVVTDSQKAWTGIIFDEESQVGKLFLTTAIRAQEAMGGYLGKINFIPYQFVEDEQTPLFFHEGSSAGLAFAELYYLHHTSLRFPLAPYTAFLGTLNEKREVETVANIGAKIQAAKENGIRILILPESNRKEVPPYEESEGSLKFLSYTEGGCSDVFSQIEFLQKESGFLPENNLPQRQNRFIGREKEISDIVELLKMEKLVNLTGTGGVGKTRLAEEVALKLLPNFPDGVWFVALSSLRDANLVLPTIASALSIQPKPIIPLEKQMIDFLKNKRLLLVLDNFEQLPHKAGTFVEKLIQNTEFVRCLVTSRDISTCPDGNQFWVAPLETPPPEVPLSVDSVKLFMSRAEELGQPLSEEHLPTVAELCRMLDGIPLAIELAAARLVDLSLSEILSRIKEQLPLQVDESTDTFDPRHQKLQSVLSWSYDLLTESEQELFAQLSVFSGGFFTEAVEEICTGKQVLGNLFNLRVKSLVQTETVQQKKRYFLLEPIRQYAADKLGNTGVSKNADDIEKYIKKAHTEYFCIRAKKQNEKLKGVERSQTRLEMELDLDNFHAAIDFAKAQEEWKLFSELVVALSWFFFICGLWSEGIQRLRQAEDALRRLKENVLLAKALHELGLFYQYQGKYEIARNLYTESLQIKREIGDKPGIADSLKSLGLIAGRQGAYEEARQFYTENLQIKRELDDKWGIVMSMNNWGIIAGWQGNYNEARQLFTESLQIARELGDKQCIAHSLINLGYILTEQKAYDKAKQILTESLRIYRKLGDKVGIAFSMNNLGGIAIKQKAYDEAKQILTESLRIRRELRDKQDVAMSLDNLGEVALYQEAYDESRKLYTESLRIRRELGDKPGIADSLHQFGRLTKAERDFRQAVLFLHAVIRLYEEMQSENSEDVIEVDETLAEIQQEVGLEQFEKMKEDAETMSIEQVIQMV